MSWLVKIAYFILFILLMAHPHFITEHIFSVPRAYVQSLVTIFIASIALILYILHQRDISKKESEKKVVEQELEISSEKLNESFRYIGKVNRQLPMLSGITTNILSKAKHNKNGKRAVLNELLATAVTSIAKAPWGMFRFVETKKQRTVTEFIYTHGHYVPLKLKIGNKELIESNDSTKQIKQLNDLYVLSTSDRKANIQCFLIFPKGKNNIQDRFSLLQVITDQAQLFFRYLYS